MTFAPFEPESRRDRRLALHVPDSALDRLNADGWIEAADVHVAARLGGLVGESDESVLASVALNVRAVREGSSCLDLAAVHADLSAAGSGPPSWLPADPAAWLAAVVGSELSAAGVVHVEFGLLYLDRYHREETQVAADLLARGGSAAPALDGAALEAGLERVFPGASWAEQRLAVRAAAYKSTTVLVGGPGTGKTSTVAGLLALLLEQAETTGRPPRIALAAPTGKAAARLKESVAESLAQMPAADRERLGRVDAMTLHRLLGWRADSSTRFRHNRTNPLPADIVVVDEASMLSLTMTARLLDALRPGTRLVLVGDPDQLASVEAGAVLADLVAGYGDAADGPIVRLRTSHRFGEQIGRLADAVRSGSADEVVAALRDGEATELEFVEVGDVAAAEERLRPRLLEGALGLRQLALSGDVAGALRALGQERLLCAHRDGPWGAATWNGRVQRWLSESVGHYGRHTAGEPLLVTANDYRLGLHNGDTGLVVLGAHGRLAAAFGEPDDPVLHSVSAAAVADTAHAMTIHKSQGSQARHVTVLLPEVDSRLLTRELLYTAITRAQERVTVVGSEAAIRGAVAHRTARASGLRHRLTL